LKPIKTVHFLYLIVDCCFTQAISAPY